MVRNSGKGAAQGSRPDGIAREFDFTDSDYRAICDLLKQRAGINLTDGKRDLAYGRMAKIVRRRGLKTIGDYLELVRTGDDEVLSEFTNALTTNVTSFFREPAQFEYMTDEYVPELLASNQSSKKLRFWSSACSTGQEPYSIAMVLNECVPQGAGWDTRLLATDLDSNVLGVAKAGIYDGDNLRGVNKKRRQEYFKRGTGDRSGSYRVSSKLQELIVFKQLNLMERWPMRGPFDAIFCRNVVIYFTKETQGVLFDRMADLLGQGRCLFLGHSESLMGKSDRFEFCGKNVYRKIK